MGKPAPPQTIHTGSICSNSHVTITIPVPVLIPYSPCTLSYPLFPLYCYHIPLSNGSRVFTRPRHLHMHALFRAATACGRRPAGPAARTEHRAARSAVPSATHSGGDTLRVLRIASPCGCIAVLSLCGAVWCCCLAVLQRVYPNTGLYLYRVAVSTDLCVCVFVCLFCSCTSTHTNTCTSLSTSQCPT